jgi:uncharacterized protein (DUF2342 family)
MGIHQGKIRDIESEAARAMLADGRASAVDWDRIATPAPVKVKAAAPVPARKRKKV